MAEIRPIAIYPSAPTGADLTALKKAKALIDTDILIKPVRAVPGSPGPLLALREKPEFVCDYALVEEVTPEQIKPALEWVLGLNNNYRGYSAIVMLREVFGPDVEEITHGQSM